MPLTNEQILTTIASIKAQLDALAIAVSGNVVPDTKPEAVNAALNDSVTIKDIQGQTITVDKVLAKGMVLKLANTRSVNVTSGGTQVTIDQPVGNGVMTGSVAVVTKVPGGSTAPAPTPDPVTTPDPAPDPAPTPSPAPGSAYLQYLHGVNMSGLGNNPYVENAIEGTHYRAPQDSHFKKYADMGCRLIRLPVAAERFVTSDDSPLAEAYVKQVRNALDLAAKYQMKIIIDLHTYYRYWTKIARGTARRSGYDQTDYNGVTKEWRPIGTEGCALSTAGYARMIGLIVSAFKDHSAYLGIGLANEPHNRGESGISVDSLWIRDVQQHVDAAAKASAKHWIFVGGCSYSSCRQWPQVSDALKNIKDSTDRVIYEGHNYLDKGTSGGGAWSNRNEVIPVDNFIAMVKPLVEWGQKNGKRVYIGEHGYPEGNQSAEDATIKGLQYLTDNKVMSTQWCAGPGWPNGDVLALDDDRGTFKTNVNAVRKFFGKTL